MTLEKWKKIDRKVFKGGSSQIVKSNEDDV